MGPKLHWRGGRAVTVAPTIRHRGCWIRAQCTESTKPLSRCRRGVGYTLKTPALFTTPPKWCTVIANDPLFLFLFESWPTWEFSWNRILQLRLNVFYTLKCYWYFLLDLLSMRSEDIFGSDTGMDLEKLSDSDRYAAHYAAKNFVINWDR
jgi:hypothetical protein